jgi:hypothetical protein
MSPLRNIKSEMVKSLGLPDELRSAVINIFKKEYNPERYSLEAEKIIEQHFCLNQASNIPDRFLSLLKETVSTCK